MTASDPIQPYPGTPGPQGPIPPAGPQGKPPRTRNTIGLIAMIVAIAGFVFAVMEGAYILGWILLPIGFVLGLVGLFQRDKPKGMAIAAVIISIVGTIAGAIAFMSSMTRIVDETLGSSGTTTAVAPASPGVQAQPTQDAAQPTQAADGKRSIELKVTTKGKAQVTYVTGGGTSSEEIKADWSKTLETDKSFEIVSVSVINGDFAKSNNVTCEILVDGQSVEKQSGSGTSAMANCTTTVS